MKQHTTVFLSIFLFLLCFSVVVSAQTPLLSWDFQGYGGQSSVVYRTINASVSATSPSGVASLGSGLTAVNYLSNGLTANNQTATSLSAAITGNDYVTFTIAPGANKMLTISSIDFRPVSQNRSRTFALFSSVKGFTTADTIRTFTYSGNNGPATPITINLTGHTNLTQSIEFRLYIYGSNKSSEAVGLGNATGDDLTINGSSSVVSSYTSVTFDPNSLPEVQLGLTGISYYNVPVFANALAIENRNWMDKTTGATIYRSSGQLDNNGYPKYLNSGQVLTAKPGQNIGTNRRNQFQGRVVLTWQGDADIRVLNGTLVSGTATGSIVNGRREYQFNTAPNGYTVEIYAINAANPPTKIRVWMPDPSDPMNKSLEPLQGQAEPLFHPSYLSVINRPQFSIYRFMDWGATNKNPNVDWADRRPANHCFQAGVINERIALGYDTTYDKKKQDAGVSYETMINLCNQTNKDMWINIPHAATDDYVTKLAKLINGKDPDGTGAVGLNSNLKIYLEYSNEIWAQYTNNYCQGQYATQMAAAAGITREQWIARRASQVWSLFQKEFNTNARLVRVLGAFTNNTTYTTNALAEAKSYGATLTPSTQPDVIAATTYFGNSIEQYVFNSIDYTSVTPDKLTQVYKEWENRLLSSEASTTGQDFTGGGGGIPGSLVTLANQNNIPIIAYEGGTGLVLSNFVYVKNCQVVVNGTSGATNAELACHAATCSGGDCNTNPFLTFMAAVLRDSRLGSMFYIHNSLAKAKGVRTVAQFGDICSMSKYGWWGFLEYLDQTPTSKMNFWLNWQPEQVNIREVNSPLNAAPGFTTNGELYPAKVGQSYSVDLNYGGGNGTLTVDTIGSGFLPTGMGFSYQTNKIVLSGTPQVAGTYRFAFRVLDADGDPAYSVFTLKVLPAVQNAVYAYDDFGTTSRALQGTVSGIGFSNKWIVQNNDSVGFAVQTTTPLSYTGLQTSGGAYGLGGDSYLTSGHSLKVSSFDYLVPANDTTVIGQTNTSLWFSGLVRRNAGAAKSQVFYFCNGSAWDATKSKVRVGVLSNGNWGLNVRNAAGTGFDVVDAGVSATAKDGQTNLLVVQFKFDDACDSVKLYINPTQLGGNAPTPNAVYGTNGLNNIVINNLGFYGSDIANQISVDDIRLGDSYAAVTPTGIQKITISANANLSTYNPTSGTDVTVSGGELTIDKNLNVKSLTVSPGAKVTLPTGNTLTVTGTLTLQSDATGTATLTDANTNGGLTVNGVTTVQQYLNKSRNWYITTPISGATASVVNPQGSSNLLYWYDETKGSPAGWTAITSNTTFLTPGLGYVVKPATDGVTLNFTGGTLNTGTNPSQTIYRTATLDHAGFNLIGNPYPSYLNARTVVNSSANLDKTIWYRTQVNNSTTYKFDTYNTASGQYINASGNNTYVVGTVPPMQAFWVRVSLGQSSATVNFNNSYRTHAVADTINPLKTRNQLTLLQPSLRLQVSNGINSDETLLYTDPNATDGYDIYDSQKMTNNNSAIPELFTLADNQQLAINGLNQIPYDTEISLGFSTITAGIFSIKASQINNLTKGTQLILKDYANINNPIIIDLTDGNGYSFNSDATTNNTSRFALIFRTSSIITSVNNQCNNDTWLSMSGGIISINGKISPDARVDIYNTLGQKILSSALIASQMQIDTHLSAGVYMINLTDKGKIIAKKIIIN